MTKIDVKPFLKWVGGKRQLIEEIEKRLPKEYNNYFEPFVGGGALFMHLQNNNMIINDSSRELIDAYETIRDEPIKLMGLLDEYKVEHEKIPKEFYYKIRELDRTSNWEKVSKLEKTARMMYLNKTCFNGLYRVNKKGQFNVPFNNKEKVNLYDKNNILNLSKLLNEKISINCGDFEKVCSEAKAGDFIFFDPPYDLLQDNTFESYTKEAFGVEGQIRLSKVAKALKAKGCYVMITNHNTPLINELYSDFNIDVINVKRFVNCKANNRTGTETIICGY